MVFKELAKRGVGGVVDPIPAGPVQPAYFDEIVDKVVARLEQVFVRCLLEPGREVLSYTFVRLVVFSESRHGCVAVVVCRGRDIEACCDLMRPSCLAAMESTVTRRRPCDKSDRNRSWSKGTPR